MTNKTILGRFLEYFKCPGCQDVENVETEDVEREDDRFSLPSQRPLPPPDIAAALTEHVRSQLFLDSSRMNFVDEITNTLENLVQGKQKGLNRFQLTLLGRKAVGKTCLLRSLQEACHKMRLKETHGLFCVWMSCRKLKTPSQAIVEALPPNLKEDLQHRLSTCANEYHIDEVVNFLEEKNLFVFGITDEFQNIYRSKDEDTVSDIISEFSFIGDSEHGRLQWILSGSSTDLRVLITGKAPLTSAFPSYQQQDLNGTKFQFRTIYPLRNVEDFEEFVGKYCQGGIELTQSIKENLFLRSGGLPGMIRYLARFKNKQNNLLANVSTYYASARGFDSMNTSRDPFCAEFMTVLARTVNAYSSCDDSEGNLLRTMTLWLKFVPLSTVVAECAQHIQNANNLYSLCFRLADEGMLCFEDAGEARLSFASPLAFLEIWSAQVKLTVEELLALKCGNMLCKSDIAGDTTIRLLNTACQRSTTAASVFFGEHLPSAKIDVLKNVIWNLDCPEDLISKEGVLMKEEISTSNKDSLGADAALFLRKDSIVNVFRVQIKILGGAQAKDQVITDVINRFKSHRPKAQEKLERCFGRDVQVVQRLVFATTANVTPPQRERLRAEGVSLWDKAMLAEHVWPKYLKDLDSKFR